jgi:steroid 5-alpha reductase family enzyme
MRTSFQKIIQRIFGYILFLICFFILYFSNTFSWFVSLNGLLQVLLFTLVVCIPAYLTKRMSYVDIGWSWGLVLIGVLVLVLGEGYWLRKYIVSGMYLFAGLRMGVGALILLKKGHLDTELSRYKYQRKRWKKAGYTNIDLSLQYEIMLQCFANVTFLAIPAILQAFNPQEFLSPLEILGYLLWLVFFGVEHVADIQKQQFSKKAFLENRKKQVCNVGLWKYSRHPNYFAEWMVWNSLILSSLPSLFYFYLVERNLIWLGLLVSLFYLSIIMYNTLVYYTGAIPSEYYSLKKRPDYKKYKKNTNMFFPGPTD